MMYLDKLTLENNNTYNKIKYAYGMYLSSNDTPLGNKNNYKKMKYAESMC